MAYGLALWMRADEGVKNEFGNPASDGDVVSVWIGQGPNKMSVGPQIGWSTPIYKENALAGHPVLKFNGASHLIIESPLQVGNVYVIANSDEANASFPSWVGIMGNKNNGTVPHIPILYGVRFGDSINAGRPGELHTNRTTDRSFLTFAEYKLFSYEPTDPWEALPPIGIGRADFGVETTSSWLGGIAEFIIYDRFLPENEAELIEGYLADRYQIVF